MTTQATPEAPNQASDLSTLKLTIADLVPAAGLTDRFDNAIFALCTTDFAIDGLTNSLERFCHQLRHASDADTVYICDRETLRILATTSAAGDTDNTDTQNIHTALINMVSDLNRCIRPVQLPEIRVFPDEKKMTFCAIPLGSNLERLAIIVDADASLKNINLYYADAVTALYRCHTNSPEQYFSPSSRQLQKFVFDELNHHYGICSTRINQRRFELFCDDLRYIDVQFEKVVELESNGEKTVWGWEVIANRPDTDQFPCDLFIAAEQWTEEFRTALDLHILNKAAFRYKETCEAENLLHLDDIKPLCLSVYPQTLLQPDYIAALRDLTEKVVTHGAKLVFELSEKISLSNDNVIEHQAELNQFAEQLQSLRDEFNVRIALDEFGAGNSSLARLICLQPDIIKMDKSLLTNNGENVLKLLDRFSDSSKKRQSAPLEVILESENTTAKNHAGTSNRKMLQAQSSTTADEATPA